jgi:hypothetical protein
MTMLQWLTVPVCWFLLTGPVSLTAAVLDRSWRDLAVTAGLLAAAYIVVRLLVMARTP